MLFTSQAEARWIWKQLSAGSGHDELSSNIERAIGVKTWFLQSTHLRARWFNYLFSSTLTYVSLRIRKLSNCLKILLRRRLPYLVQNTWFFFLLQSYPFVLDLERGLNKLNQCVVKDSTEPELNGNPTSDGKPGNAVPKVIRPQRQITCFSGPVQNAGSSKFLLGRVASNEDICIQTEAPFVFTIAATDKEICITKVASVDDLKRFTCSENPETDKPQQQQQQRKFSQPTRRTVPVNLRLTFGSESSLPGCERSRKPDALPPGSSYRVMYHVDIPYGSNVAHFRRDALRRAHSVGSRNPFRYSLPCISYREDEPKPIALVSWTLKFTSKPNKIDSEHHFKYFNFPHAVQKEKKDARYQVNHVLSGHSVRICLSKISCQQCISRIRTNFGFTTKSHLPD